MISILVPIYNLACGELLCVLDHQARSLSIPYEIVAFEDGSTLHVQENEKIARQLGIRYQRNKYNMGRAAIRNQLARHASYEHLLFMDCDVIPFKGNYLKGYVDRINQGSYDIVCGGRKMPTLHHDDCQYSLNWATGTFRENTHERQPLNPTFLSNNFLIRRQLFSSISFEEKLKQYGHEDTLFGIHAREHGFQIEYITNPVLHVDLESNESFLHKTCQGLENLSVLRRQYLTEAQCQEIKLLRAYSICEKLKLSKLLAHIHNASSDLIGQILIKKYPNLYLLDWYKLGYFCWFEKKRD